MNVESPEALVTIRSPSTLGRMMGRAFMLQGRLPSELEALVSRLPGSPVSNTKANRKRG
jgi:hypothetical protein